ncbi:MAG: DNA polymerase III subunit delta' [Rhodothermales bacterium]|nr:DNA polymerase III subunit delta' [Rhodothermales bacterium]
MGWDIVVGQETAKGALKHAIESDRVSHAYLFHGPDGSGKRALALSFAQALLCLRREDTASDPCGACESCRKVERLVHPDVHFLMPFPDKDPPADLRKRQEMVAAEPYRIVDYSRRPSIDDLSKTSNKQTLYNIEWVHENLIRAMSFKPVEGEYKIAIIADADKLNSSSANAFLKRLEEPYPDTIFILITVRPDHLPSTIVSRTQKVFLRRLDSEPIRLYLLDRGVGADDAMLISRMADGSLSRALDLADHIELRSGREVVVDFMRVAIVDDAQAVEEAIRLLVSSGREQLKSYLDLLLSWIRDLVVLDSTGEAEMLVNLDQYDAIKKFVENLPDADLERMVKLVEEAIHLVERNVNATSAMRCLSIGLRDAMKGRRGGNLYQPLSGVKVGSASKNALA